MQQVIYMALGSIIYAAVFWEISPDKTGPENAAEIEPNMEVSFTMKFACQISLLFLQTLKV